MLDLAAAAAEARRVFAIPQAERALLARIGETQVVPAGHLLIAEGDAGGRRIGLITTGGIVGEMALFNAKRRLSTVRALTECKLVQLAARSFLQHVHRGDAAAIAIMERLGSSMIARVQLAERAHSLGPQGEDDPSAQVRRRMLREWALRYHALGKPGKIEVQPTRTVGTIADIAVAYAPGAIAPCVAIHRDPHAVWEYTARGRLVGVVSNGTSVLGKGALGPESVKPLLEGKVVLLKRFAGLDAFDLELAELDPTRLVDLLCAVEPTFGALALEHLVSPASLAVVDACTRRMQIPIVHDEQHCVGVVAVAALLNGLLLARKPLHSARIVISGAGPAAVGVGQLLRALKVDHSHLVVIDRDGPMHPGRSLRTWFLDLAASPCPATRAEAIAGADVYVGCGAAAPLSTAELRTMAPQPVVVCLGVPEPEMSWPDAMRTRNDVIMATSSGTHCNHATTLLVFPHLLRALLDCRATHLPMAALCAAATGLAALARAVGSGDAGVPHTFGPKYLLPSVVDPRLPQTLPVAIADAIAVAGAAGLQVDLEVYRARRQRFKLTLS